MRTGDSIEGEIRASKNGERYFALIKLNKINGQKPDSVKNRISNLRNKKMDVKYDSDEYHRIQKQTTWSAQ